jgi:dTDP-4-dehydrorhamnose 3,5-epimerase
MIKVYEGGSFSDNRGVVDFYNTFDLSEVKRMYTISPTCGVIRAWQGHRIEKKWFYVVQGSFEIQLCKVNFWSPLTIENREKITLSESSNLILEIPGGYLNGFVALEESSKMIVFSDYSLEDSKNDDYRIKLENVLWEIG